MVPPLPLARAQAQRVPRAGDYAQGFPTDITFSESIGFLTKSDPQADVAFMVTAHEAAHQWWGNMVAPGKGPGGNLLSEGTAHFSTLLLFEQVKGVPAADRVRPKDRGQLRQGPPGRLGAAPREDRRLARPATRP